MNRERFEIYFTISLVLGIVCSIIMRSMDFLSDPWARIGLCFAVSGVLTFLYIIGMYVYDIVCRVFNIVPDDGDSDDVDDDIAAPDSLIAFSYEEYVHGIARVERRVLLPDGSSVSSSYSYVDESGELITNMFFEFAGTFEENISAPVANGGLYNLVGRDGQLLCSEWMYGMSKCFDGKYKVVNGEGLVNYLRTDGTLCWKEWKKELQD